MTAYRAIVAERKDFEIVTVVCPDCDTTTSFNPESGRVPLACPSCGMDFGQPTREALAALGRFHRTARNAEEKAGKPIFRFEMKQPD